ncbi:hypothetical protein A6A03_04745 [Chloroflexus islandicus]|uniref:Uncharacterized protein n=1 Tax=Chloroflexus islandicus TaxID=1707952 RepID=A0A178LX10_9CHLR|nr:hypothetical protein A6A03_04745 [Chloroflexus islandicus]
MGEIGFLALTPNPLSHLMVGEGERPDWRQRDCYSETQQRPSPASGRGVGGEGLFTAEGAEDAERKCHCEGA